MDALTTTIMRLVGPFHVALPEGTGPLLYALCGDPVNALGDIRRKKVIHRFHKEYPLKLSTGLAKIGPPSRKT